jgi:hypothetical protein
MLSKVQLSLAKNDYPISTVFSELFNFLSLVLTNISLFDFSTKKNIFRFNRVNKKFQIDFFYTNQNKDTYPQINLTESLFTF